MSGAPAGAAPVDDAPDGPLRWMRLGTARFLDACAALDERDTHDYTFVDWLYGPTALEPDEEPPAFVPIPLGTPPATIR
ncbi:hypothetical protein ACFZBU_06620 [Embleya sp. NPDC008237]|uniref:hypothetical protein n=1 Tax=Embleya sp. NPDC008237 TaxID=3363978 RepID=UPI0036E0A7B9